MSVPAALGRVVVRRAVNRCEYCGLSQAGQEARFHVDHIEPDASGGPTVVENLALACVYWSLRKGARVELVAQDGQTDGDFQSAAAAVWKIIDKFMAVIPAGSGITLHIRKRPGTNSSAVNQAIEKHIATKPAAERARFPPTIVEEFIYQ